MSVFSGASNVVVNDGNFIAIQAPKDWEKEREALRQLEQHVAFGAFHNSKERRDPPKCHPRTREAVFREIAEWIRATSTDKPILWLYGPAGAGKSAIAQSIAEKVYRQEILGCLLAATFFFNRSNGERNNADRIVSSLAYQMIFSVPGTRESVLNAIVENPRVFSLNLATQMEKLIIEPLLSNAFVHPADESPAMLIIIDGLDECQDSDERTEFIEALTESVRNSAFNLMILCHSRPESDIRTAFNDIQTSKLTVRLVLGNRFEPDTDIEVLLHHSFSEIKRIHPLKNRLPRCWPSEETIEVLVRKSSGQFIYPSTVMKYIASRKHNPMKRLEVVLNVGSGTDASPFKELDALYLLVLSSVDENDRPTLVRIIGMICFPGLYGAVLVTPELIDDVLNLEPGGALLILDDLHSLIDVHDPKDIELDGSKVADLDDSKEIFLDKSEIGLRPFHASFSDFLQDRSRSYEYYVDHAVATTDCALAWFKAQLHIIVDSSPKYRLAQLPYGHFGGNLTIDLVEFFMKIPWKLLVEKGLPIRLPVMSFINAGWINDPWILGVSEFYHFCQMASGTSPAWASIFKLASTEITAWLAQYWNLISSFANLKTICSVQDELRLCYVLQLIESSTFHIQRPGEFITEMLQTPGISLIDPIDRKKRNFAIFDTILEGLVMARLLDHESRLTDDRLDPRGVCNGCMDYLTRLLDLVDRTSYIDTLLSYVEREDSPCSVLRNQEQVKQAIRAYKEKPISDEYDYDFRLEPSVEVLRERFKSVCAARSNKMDDEIGLSELGVCNFIRFENFRIR